MVVAVALLLGLHPDDELASRMERWVHDARTVGFSGAVLAARDGELLFATAVGTSGPDGSPLTTETLFEIASVSKQFTAAAVLLLRQDGALELDDPLHEHLPDIPDDCRAITLRHLLQHTSGISPRNSRGRGEYDEVVAGFLAGGPQHEPGTHFAYWNQGYALLSEVVARASGRPFTDFCRERIFEPAGLEATCFTGDQAPGDHPVATGTSSVGAPRTALEHPYGSFGLQYRGMGGVVTNVHDLWRWERVLAEGSLLDEESLAELFAPGPGGYALGWRVGRTLEDTPYASHGGSVRGFTCELRRYPSRDGALIVLSNRQGDLSMRRFAYALQAMLLGERSRAPAPPAPLDADTLEDLVGEYVDERGNVFGVDDGGGWARVRIDWAASFPTTRAALGREPDGPGLVLHEWAGLTPVEVFRTPGRPARGLEIHASIYERR